MSAIIHLGCGLHACLDGDDLSVADREGIGDLVTRRSAQASTYVTLGEGWESSCRIAFRSAST